jgi:2-polyprenyl-3-methyl-5-hydroxy-6-metoxy-1,4-benzoquinol methylase
MIQTYDICYKEFHFYHTFYLGDTKTSVDKWTFDEENNDVLIKGQWDHNPIALDLLNLMDFTGQTVLDVGCADGYYSLLAEKKGNFVTSMDLYDSYARRYVFSHLNSKNNFLHKNVYSLHQIDQMFDVGMIGDILLHLENPLGVLKMLRQKLNKKIFLVSDFIDGGGKSYIEIQNIVHTPFRFTIESLETMLKIAGFKNINFVKSLHIKSTTSKYSYCNRELCVITADVDEDYVFAPIFSAYYPVIV